MSMQNHGNWWSLSVQCRHTASHRQRCVLQVPAFQTARAKLATDVRTGRSTLVPKEPSSGQMFPQGKGAVAHSHRAGLQKPPGSRAPQGMLPVSSHRPMKRACHLSSAACAAAEPDHTLPCIFPASAKCLVS